MTAKHTPGPWETLGQFITAKNPAVRLPNSQTIARVFGDHPVVGGDTEANARLIAAAPDMLQVCELVVFYADNGIRFPHEVTKFAREVVAEVEGRQ